MNQKELMGSTCVFTSGIKEPEIDRQASDFISGHFFELVKAAHKMGVDANKCEDIVQDVTLSILKQEEYGEGYDMNKGNRSEPISPREFVYGRLKMYSKNVKYRKQTEAPVFVKGADGKAEEQMNIIPSTVMTDDLEQMTKAQRDFVNAQKRFLTDDDAVTGVDAVDEAESIEEQMKYVLSFDRMCNGSISALLKKIDYFKENPDNKEYKDFCNFSNFKAPFIEALTDIIKFSGTNREKYDAAIKNVFRV